MFESMDAVMDCGALLAGASNRQVNETLLPLVSQHHSWVAATVGLKDQRMRYRRFVARVATSLALCSQLYGHWVG